MQQYRRSTMVDSSPGAFIGPSYSGAVALLVFLTAEMLMSQLFFAGEWWGVKNVWLSLLLALAPAALLTILFVALVNWLVDRRESDRTASQRAIERSGQPLPGEHVFLFDEGGSSSQNTARPSE